MRWCCLFWARFTSGKPLHHRALLALRPRRPPPITGDLVPATTTRAQAVVPAEAVRVADPVPVSDQA